MVNNCPNCGSPVNPGVSFCPNCGASLAAQSNPQPMQAAVPRPKPARKRLGKKVIAALAVALVLLIAIAAAAALSGGNNGNNSAGLTPQASNDVIAIKVLEVRATDDPNTAPMDIASPPDYGMHFVFVNVSVTNKGTSSEWYGPNMFHLFVGENAVEDLTHEVPALDKVQYKTPVGVQAIPAAQPGETVSLWVPYQVEDGMELQKLVYINSGEESLTLLFGAS